MKVEINLRGGNAPSGGLRIPIPGVRLTHELAEEWVEIDGERRPAWVIRRATRLPSGLGAAVPTGSVGLVVGNEIPEIERESLQAEGLRWLDFRGSIYLG